MNKCLLIVFFVISVKSSANEPSAPESLTFLSEPPSLKDSNRFLFIQFSRFYLVPSSSSMSWLLRGSELRGTDWNRITGLGRVSFTLTQNLSKASTLQPLRSVLILRKVRHLTRVPEAETLEFCSPSKNI